MTKPFLGLALAAAIAVTTPAAADTIVPGFNGQGALPSCDDCYSSAISTGFAMNFFGTTRTQLFVSNNGYVTFDAGQSAFTPSGLGASYGGLPIIAPFFADVDTRGGLGSVTFGTGTFNGRSAWGVNWIDTGYYSVRGDKRNSFQLILTDRSDTGAGNFDIYFNYSQIQWETGSLSGGVNGLGGISAAVGFNAAQGGCLEPSMSWRGRVFRAPSSTTGRPRSSIPPMSAYPASCCSRYGTVESSCLRREAPSPSRRPGRC
ncbi:MAG: nidogen-like domain-containing protein [Sphingomonadaceae bacterium]